MEAIFKTASSDALVPYCMEYDQFGDSYDLQDDAYEPTYEGMSDELGSLEQSYASSSIPNSPLSDSPRQNTEQQQTVYSYEAGEQQQQPQPQQQQQEQVPEVPVKTESGDAAEAVIRPAQAMARQPAAKRARTSANSTPAQPASLPLAESKFPDLLNTDNLNSYMQSLAKGKSEDIELFRNVLRCHGSLTPDAERQLKHLARQVKNRESAQLSRQRKREYVQTLKGVIDKMRSVDNTLRTDLSSVQTELKQCKTEAEKWQNYARELQKKLQEAGIQVPKEPDALVKTETMPSHTIPQVYFPETLFDGPCGFGHMTPPKTSGKKRGRRSRADKAKEAKAAAAAAATTTSNVTA